MHFRRTNGTSLCVDLSVLQQMCAHFVLATSSELGARDGAGSPELVKLPTEGEQMEESPRTPGGVREAAV